MLKREQQHSHCRRCDPLCLSTILENLGFSSGALYSSLCYPSVNLSPHMSIVGGTYLYASLSETKPNSAVEYTTRSSAMRLTCVMIKLDHVKNSTIKSRSPTPHMLFSATDMNPSSRARNSRSTAKGLPARAPLPKGRTETRGISC